MVATWNIRWFPRGCPNQEDCEESATNLDWLACTIAWMGADLIALQEILATPDANTSLGLLKNNLQQLTGDTWDDDLQSCGGQSSQHVGFLWNTARVGLTNMTDEEQLNGAFDGHSACAGNLRPGRYARAKSTKTVGVDFHVLAVHLDSGRADRDFDHRRAAIAELPFLAINGALLPSIGDGGGPGDNDILVIGDWNTMGKTGTTDITEDQEISILDQEIASEFTRIVPAQACSEYFFTGGVFHAGLLDHVVASAGTEEISTTSRICG